MTEQIDRQFAGLSTSTPFMDIEDSSVYDRKTVVFDIQRFLDNRIDKLSAMMEKLTTQNINQGRPFKPKVYQGKMRGQGRPNYYDRGRQQSRYRSNSGDRYSRSPYRGRSQY